MRGAGYGIGLPCKLKFHGDKFSCDWLAEKLTKENFDVLYEKKKLIVIEMTVFCLGQCAIKPLKIKPMSLKIFLILFTVRLQEDILDPVDPK